MIRRVVGLTLRPAETFAEIVRKPDFLAPLALTVTLLVGLVFLAVHRIGPERIFAPIAKTLQHNPDLAGQPPEIVAGALAMVLEGCVLVIVPLVIPLTAISLMPVIWGLGGKTSLRPLLAAVAWAGLPPALATFLTGAAVLLLRDPARLSLESLMPFNLGVLVPGKLAHDMASSIELFSLWSVVLLAYGMAAASGLSFRRCFVAVAPPLFLSIWLLIAVVAVLV